MGGRSKVEGQRSAEEEGEGQEVGREGKGGSGEKGEGFPERTGAEGDVVETDDLEDGEGQGEEGRPEEREGDAEERGEGEEEEGEEDEAVMKRDGALPGETSEEREAFVFEIVGEGGKIEDEEIGEGERGDGKREDRQETVKVASLQNESERGEHVADVRGEQ